MTPPQLALRLQSLPPILHVTVPSPMSGYSKAPRGLFVLPRVARVFTGTAISPSPPSRQWPSRSTIHAGRNLPDKGLRYLRHFVTPRSRSGGPVISAGLCMSPYRSDHIFSTVPFAEFGVWSLRIPGKLLPLRYRFAGGLSSPAYLHPNSQLNAEFTLRRAAQDLG